MHNKRPPLRLFYFCAKITRPDHLRQNEETPAGKCVYKLLYVTIIWLLTDCVDVDLFVGLGQVSIMIVIFCVFHII